MRFPATRQLRIAVAVAALAAFAVGGAIGYSVTSGGDVLYEDAVTTGGGTGLTPTAHFVNMNSGALVAGAGATTSGHSAFFGPNLEPVADPPAAAISWQGYE